MRLKMLNKFILRVKKSVERKLVSLKPSNLHFIKLYHGIHFLY
jgi:hypothetical protein